MLAHVSVVGVRVAAEYLKAGCVIQQVAARLGHNPGVRVHVPVPLCGVDPRLQVHAGVFRSHFEVELQEITFVGIQPFVRKRLVVFHQVRRLGVVDLLDGFRIDHLRERVQLLIRHIPTVGDHGRHLLDGYAHGLAEGRGRYAQCGVKGSADQVCHDHGDKGGCEPFPHASPNQHEHNGGYGHGVDAIVAQ